MALGGSKVSHCETHGGIHFCDRATRIASAALYALYETEYIIDLYRAFVSCLQVHLHILRYAIYCYDEYRCVCMLLYSLVPLVSLFLFSVCGCDSVTVLADIKALESHRFILCVHVKVPCRSVSTLLRAAFDYCLLTITVFLRIENK